MPIIPIIEKAVVEATGQIMKNQGAMQESTVVWVLRQALLDVAQQVRLDTLEEVEKHAEGMKIKSGVGSNCDDNYDLSLSKLLSHIASLKQQPL